VMVFGIVYVFMAFVVRDHVQLGLLIMVSPTGILTTKGCLIISDFAENRQNMSTCVIMTPVKSLLNQTTHSKVMIRNPNAPDMSIIG